MESVFSFGTKTPLLFVFLIDQSASMMNVSVGGGNRAEIAALNIQNAIIEIIDKCVAGTQIKNRAYISVIGYGNHDESLIIHEGWVSEWVEYIQSKKNDTFFIPIVTEFIPTMGEGLSMAGELCRQWICARESDNEVSERKLSPIIVLNITKGTTTDEQKTFEAANRLMALQNTYLYNIVIPAEIDDCEDILFPLDNPFHDDYYRELLFEMSSIVPSISVDQLRFQGLSGFSKGCRGFAVSSSIYTASLFCRISMIVGCSAFKSF